MTDPITAWYVGMAIGIPIGFSIGFLLAVCWFISQVLKYFPKPKSEYCKGCGKDITDCWQFQGYGWCCVKNWKEEKKNL